MVRLVRAATLVALGSLLLTARAAQADPPYCPDDWLVTSPGERIALAAPPCIDPDGDTYRIDVVTLPTHGTIAGGDFYTPATGYHGTDEFRYSAIDSSGEQSEPATVNILIDTAPECADATATVESGEQLALPFVCDDADGDDLNIYVGDPLHGTLDFPDGDAIYTPAAGYVGHDTVSYDADDRFGLASTVVTLTITVTAPSLDTTPPSLKLMSLPQKLKSALRSGLRLHLTPDERGTASVTLTLARATARKLKLPVKVGGLKTSVPAGRSTVVVKLTAKARTAIKKLRKVKLLVTVVIRDVAGYSTTKTLKVTLKR